MSVNIKVKDSAVLHANEQGIVVKKIPGGEFYIVHLNNGHRCTFHEKEFERLPNSKPVYKETTIN